MSGRSGDAWSEGAWESGDIGFDAIDASSDSEPSEEGSFDGDEGDGDGGSEPEAPSLGDVRNGYELVCHGDDSPSEFEHWLGALVKELRALQGVAAEYKLDHGNTGIDEHTELDEFLERIGVRLDSDFWEGACISGHYQYGWIKEDSADKVERKGERLLAQFRRSILKSIRAKLRERLALLEDPADLAVLACADVMGSHRRVPQLEREVEKLRKETEYLREYLDECLEKLAPPKPGPGGARGAKP